MSNSCTIPIATGINKGKLCRDINKYCRHRASTCDVCGEIFRHRSSLDRHKINKHPQKKVVDYKKKTGAKVSIEEYNQLQTEMQELRRQVNERIDKIEQEPKNIIIIGDEKMFYSLSKKLGGDDKAMQFLFSNISPDNSIDIVDKLYLEGVEKDKYPIACTDGYRFRYLNRSGQIVDDKGGTKIVSKLGSEIHTAMVEANSKLLREAAQHRNIYDIALLQQQVLAYRKRVDQMKLREDLARKVYNSRHPFFGPKVDR